MTRNAVVAAAVLCAPIASAAPERLSECRRPDCVYDALPAGQKPAAKPDICSPLAKGDDGYGQPLDATCRAVVAFREAMARADHPCAASIRSTGGAPSMAMVSLENRALYDTLAEERGWPAPSSRGWAGDGMQPAMEIVGKPSFDAGEWMESEIGFVTWSCGIADMQRAAIFHWELTVDHRATASGDVAPQAFERAPVLGYRDVPRFSMFTDLQLLDVDDSGTPDIVAVEQKADGGVIGGCLDDRAAKACRPLPALHVVGPSLRDARVTLDAKRTVHVAIDTARGATELTLRVVGGHWKLAHQGAWHVVP